MVENTSNRASDLGSQPGRVIWINGPFGIGKSTVGQLVLSELEAQGSTAILYDPEQIGERLRSEGRTPTNYHDSAEWRKRIRREIQQLARTPQTVVVPQTIGQLEHFDEIIGGLREAVLLHHFTLQASPRVHHERIANDSALRGEWGLNWNPSIVNTQRDARYEIFIGTDQLAAAEIADLILDQVRAKLNVT